MLRECATNRNFLRRAKRRISIVAVVVASALLHLSATGAQQLSIVTYDVSDGLAHGRVVSIHQDRKGYIWFATNEGLSRFDGYQFTNYGTRDGLGSMFVNIVTEDRRGRIWVGTNGGGVARLLDDPAEHLSQTPAARKKFVTYRIDDLTINANQVNQIIFDEQDNLWCLTDAGLYRSISQKEEPAFEKVWPGTQPYFRQAGYQDHKGRLWFGFRNELIEYDHGKTVKHISTSDETLPHEIHQVVEDPRGRLLALGGHGVYEFVEPTGANSRGVWRALRLDLKPKQFLTSLASYAGSLWLGTSRGLIKYDDGKQTLYTAKDGLSEDSISTLKEDRDGNLWITTGSRGVCKISGARIISVTQREGLPVQGVTQVIENKQGQMYALLENGSGFEITGEQASSLAPPLSVFALKLVVQDRRNDWWVGTDKGLYKFDGPKLQFQRGRRFTRANGIMESLVGKIFEDGSGKIWVTALDETTGDFNLYRFDPERERHVHFERITSDQLPTLFSIISDTSGTLWFGGYSYLAKLDHGRLMQFQPTAGLPSTEIRGILLDSRGWVWVGLRFHGLSLTRNPTAENPQWINYSTENGLASDTVWGVAEGNDGRIYLGTGRGLDQLDALTGRIRHLTGDLVHYCIKDSQGNIWVAGSGSLSKIDPRSLTEEASPPTYFSRVQSAGDVIPLPETGVLHVPFKELSFNNNLSIDYLALSFQGEHRLKYQYKLEPLDKDWSAPSVQRTVNYARLAPGSYQFLVRAINEEGVVSPEPATFEFRILAPIWQRWWFMALIAAFLMAGGLALHRFRLRQFMAMEKIRRQVATDLHDDVGSGLAQVAILSEVAKREASPDGQKLMSEVADLARSMRESMGDIVWAVDPRHDKLTDLVARMKQAAYNLIEANGLRVEWHIIDAGELARINLGPDVRRHLLLIFKEALTNVARHARATQVRVEILASGRNLHLTVKDNGRGFDQNTTSNGHGRGLHGLRERASELGAELIIDSPAGAGTVVTLKLPLK